MSTPNPRCCDEIGRQDKHDVRVVQARNVLDAQLIKIEISSGLRNAIQPRFEIQRIESE